ncbi:SDR family oxidoreductase [Actinoplanes friuliensis]|uniref:Short-chain dehydrogenase/reductase SDR n=1 Tax=Actinoplanes friuliensis DSM 7358 TaxID=1246995 RepID=U5WDE6_9ACTN|nr:SDR family oxidoreductase [Actinoplanes friuliensis]AGZ45971.1 short-chain dehydrogenase/reductase SDR [Actinoplanes friuliensis DSM 7358]
MTDLEGTTAVVTGASRGFGREISTALVTAGARVVGIARKPDPLHELQDRLGPAFVPIAADAADESLAVEVLTGHRPTVLVLNAGVVPPMGPVDELTWAEFSENWSVDTRHAFEWTRAALRLPLAKGSIVVAMSSGAALRGSPVSGGYAAAKTGVKFISTYAAAESERRDLGLRFATVFPQLTPATEFGAAAVAAYAARQGPTADLPVLTPQQVARHVLDLIGGTAAYVEHALTADGPRELG